MKLNTIYYAYTVHSDPKTMELLALATQKGVKILVKDLQSDSIARRDFHARGFSRFPIVVQSGKPAFVYVGDFDKTMAQLRLLDDKQLETRQTAFVPVKPAAHEAPRENQSDGITKPDIGEITSTPTSHGPTAESLLSGAVDDTGEGEEQAQQLAQASI